MKQILALAHHDARGPFKGALGEVPLKAARLLSALCSVKWQLEKYYPGHMLKIYKFKINDKAVYRSWLSSRQTLRYRNQNFGIDNQSLTLL